MKTRNDISVTRGLFCLFPWLLSQSNLGIKAFNLLQCSSSFQLFPTQPTLQEYSVQKSEILQYRKATLSLIQLFYFKDLLIYLRERETDHGHTAGRDRRRWGERESQAVSMLSAETDRAPSHDPGFTTWAEIKNQKLHQMSHSRTSQLFKITFKECDWYY